MIRDKALDLNPSEHQSRQRWANAAAAILSQMPMPTIHTIVAAGEDEFIRVASPIMAGHAFKREDFKRMFEVLRLCSVKNRKIHPKLILSDSR